MSLDEIIQKPENLSGTREFIAKLKEKEYVNIETTDKILVLDGQDLSENVIIENGFKKPIMIKDKEGLNMRVPNKHFDYADICSKLGPNYLLDVIDTGQQTVEKMNFKNFVNYFQETPRSRTLNVLSLELSRTNISHLVEPPHIVSRLSVAQKLWPYESEKYFKKPMVEKYCLMTMKDAWTDFHIDFGGSSVWYHVLKGSKVFYVIPPRRKYIKGYCKWMKCPVNRTKFFPDQVKNCDGSECEIYKLKVECGNTILLPAGWVHAVHTPEDSLVFGGNFIHLYSVNMQIKVYKIERTLKTEEKFLFPYFQKLHWFIAYYLMNVLQYAHSHGMQPQKSYLKAAVVLLSVLPKWLADCLEMTESARADLLPVKGDFELTKLEMLEQLSDIVEKIMNERSDAANASPRSSICASESSTRSSSIHSQRNMGPPKEVSQSKLTENDNLMKGDARSMKNHTKLNHPSKINSQIHESQLNTYKDNKKEIPCYPTSFQVHRESSSSCSSSLIDTSNDLDIANKLNNHLLVMQAEKKEKSSICQWDVDAKRTQGNLNYDSEFKSQTNERSSQRNKNKFHESTSEESASHSSKIMHGIEKSLHKNNSGLCKDIEQSLSFEAVHEISLASCSKNLFGTNNKRAETNNSRNSCEKVTPKRERSRSPISTKTSIDNLKSPPKLEKQALETFKPIQSSVNVRKTNNFLKSQSEMKVSCDIKTISSVNKACIDQQKIENVNKDTKLPPKLKPYHDTISQSTSDSVSKNPVESTVKSQTDKSLQVQSNSPPKLKPVTHDNHPNVASKYPKTYAEYKALKSNQAPKRSPHSNLMPPKLEQITELKSSTTLSQPYLQSTNHLISGPRFRHTPLKHTYQPDTCPTPSKIINTQQNDIQKHVAQNDIIVTSPYKTFELSSIPKDELSVSTTGPHQMKSPSFSQNVSFSSPSSTSPSPTKKVHNPFLKKTKPTTPIFTSSNVNNQINNDHNKSTGIKTNTTNTVHNPYLKRKPVTPQSGSTSINNRNIPSQYCNLTPSKSSISSNPESLTNHTFYSNHTVPRSQTIHNHLSVASSKSAGKSDCQK